MKTIKERERERGLRLKEERGNKEERRKRRRIARRAS